jgi:hypothetical protein
MYNSTNFRTLARPSGQEVINNQIILTGTEELVLDDGVFMLEYLDAAAEVTVSDGKGETIAVMQSFSQDHSPLRCNNGIKFSGAIKMAKGYKIEGVL